ncbi:uncharacterized protein LOC131639290 [Vicia villosa]|uniref:uncharacterized protein LOC131626109 n=1 Tax=Vicia villosa TaxID=3911 RepID=UPI00273B2837|nr:uncharacterized protein LOC131626109 [Vicia villosa]XP_058765776.1 uncharacterized protein LOC131639290 [Vicia villosa]
MSANSYAVSSNSCVSRRRQVRCFCDLDSPLTTSWTKENPGRRFNGCGLYKLQGRKGCNFFNWYDEEMSGRAKEVILSLMKRIDEDKKKDNLKMKQDDNLKKKLRFCQGLVILVVVLIVGLICNVMLKKC